MSLKQQELLVLLVNSGHGEAVSRWLRSAMHAEPEDLASIVKEYMLQPVTLEDSMARYGHLFPGYNPVPMNRVANAYVLSVEGAVNGQIIKV